MLKVFTTYFLSYRPLIIYAMPTDADDKRKKVYSSRRSLMDLGMGIIYALLGGFFAFSEFFGIAMEFPTKPFSYIFGGICLLYGAFRIYRGVSKNYFK
jgi:hypothetical protein